MNAVTTATADLGHVGGLKPDSIARALARRAARSAGRPPSDGNRLFEAAAALREREAAGDSIPTLTEEFIETVLLNGGSLQSRSLLAARARQAARYEGIGVVKLGLGPTLRLASGAVTDNGPLSAQLRALLPRVGSARGAVGVLR